MQHPVARLQHWHQRDEYSFVMASYYHCDYQLTQEGASSLIATLIPFANPYSFACSPKYISCYGVCTTDITVLRYAIQRWCRDHHSDPAIGNCTRGARGKWRSRKLRQEVVMRGRSWAKTG